MSPLESVDCVFQFFGEGPQFAVVEENTRNICIESSDFYCVADFSAVNNLMLNKCCLCDTVSKRPPINTKTGVLGHSSAPDKKYLIT